jgi:hypothetical protein
MRNVMRPYGVWYDTQFQYVCTEPDQSKTSNRYMSSQLDASTKPFELIRKIPTLFTIKDKH